MGGKTAVSLLGVTFLLLGAELILPGCQSPIETPTPLERTVQAMIDREISGLPPQTQAQVTTQPPESSAVEGEIVGRRDELQEISPATPENRTPFSLGNDLTGGEQKVVSVDLATTIAAAVANNLSIQIARLDPAINQTDVINAEAAFDVVLFSDLTWSKIDQPSTVPVLGGVPLGTPYNASETTRFDTGVRKALQSGGEITAEIDVDRFRSNSPGLDLLPDPAYTSSFRLGLSQPLLRGFGEEVNTATIRLAGNSESRAIAFLRSDLLDIVQRTETAYWDLVLAWREVEIRQWLVDVGIDVRNKLDTRRNFDTTLAQYADAVARVETRRADVIRARRRLRSASDNLKVLINDDAMGIGSEIVLQPNSRFVDSPIEYDLREALFTALQFRPEIDVALLSIDDASIARVVADNGRLPLLNLAGEIAYYGMDSHLGDSLSSMFDDQFIDYFVAANFEYPIGNRAALATFKRTRLQYAQALLGYQRTVQDIVFDVKDALRDVVTNYQLIAATHSSRIAQAENLRALQVEEDTLAGLTPEFLNLKFQRQEFLAVARFDEFQALANFDQALAALYNSLGTGLQMQQIDLEIIEDVPADEDIPDRIRRDATAR